jgi:arylsulfatase A-like enzyme
MNPALSRRHALAATAAIAAGTPALAAAPVQKPNILWLVSEDNYPFIGAYGDALARTPNIDALAARGVLFKNAYCNAPVCAPSRFAILTGVNGESCAPANHMRARAALPKVFKTYPELMRSAGYFCTNNPKTDYNCDVDPDAMWDIQGREGHWRKAPEGQPFLCVLNLGTTHESQTCEPVAGEIKPEQIRVPAYLPDTPGIREAYATYYNLMQRMDAEVGMRLAQLEADGLSDDTIVFYYSDNGGVLPGSKRYCHEEGMRVALTIYVPPKWRSWLGVRPGSVRNDPVTLVDLPPTLLAIAGIPRPPQMVGKPLLGRDARTAAYAFGGRDRMDERYDFVRTVTDGRWRYIRNYMPHRPSGQHVHTPFGSRDYRDWEAAYRAGTLSPAQAAFFKPRAAEEIYDLSSDPDEVHNRIDDRQGAAAAARMRRVLDAHMVRINDNGFLPEGMAGEGYFESRDGEVYPLRRLMRLGAAAAQGDPANIPMFEQALGDQAPVVRYWGAMGLRMLEEAAAPAVPRLELTMRSDPSQQVRILASETLARLNRASGAVAVLADCLGEQKPDAIQLQAINALTYVGRAAEAAKPAIMAASLRRTPGGSYSSASGNRPLADYVRRCAEHLLEVLAGAYDPAKVQPTPIEACRRAKEGALTNIGSEGSFPN